MARLSLKTILMSGMALVVAWVFISKADCTLGLSTPGHRKVQGKQLRVEGGQTGGT